MSFRRYYIENSMLFITIVTNNRIPILIDNINIFKNAIKNTQYAFKTVAGVVLPDHCHLIIHPKNIKEFPKIISSIKYTFSKNINFEKHNKTQAEITRQERCVWQRRYYDHIIRDEQDFHKHLDYIHYNPIKHNMVNSAKDWKFSSFNKFVNIGLYDENWCNFEDKNDIVSLDLE